METTSRRRFLGAGFVTAVSLTTPTFVAASAQSEWDELRAGFDLEPALTYLNTGTLGALPRRVRETRARAELDFAHDPPHVQTQALLDKVRRGLAGLTNGSPDDIAITRNTTEGLNLFAAGLELRPGDEIIVSSEEHNAAIAPYRALERRAGIKLVRVALPVGESVDHDQILEAYRRAITPRTRVLVASHVAYRSGVAMPLRELAALAHSRGILISVDGAQAFGILPP